MKRVGSLHTLGMTLRPNVACEVRFNQKGVESFGRLRSEYYIRQGRLDGSHGILVRIPHVRSGLATAPRCLIYIRVVLSTISNTSTKCSNHSEASLICLSPKGSSLQPCLSSSFDFVASRFPFSGALSHVLVHAGQPHQGPRSS